MNLATHPNYCRRGIALIIVMICITVLAIMAAGFAYSMKVETRLAMNSNSEADLLAIGWGSIQKAAALLSLRDPAEQWDSLNQKWAGGPGSSMTSNSLLALITLEPNTKIVDMERRANINMADQQLLDQAMRMIGVDATDSGAVTAAILDWIDPDKNEHINGAETDYYETLDPPYKCKDAPIDDLSELLLVRGVTQEIFWGGVATNHAPASFQSKLGMQQRGNQANIYPVGLADLFSPYSAGPININTAPREVLAMVLNGDEAAADRIVACRAGPDGADGTEDDVPFRSANDALACAQLPTAFISQVGRYFNTRSRLFQVEVHAEVNGTHRYFYAVVDRDAQPDKKILTFFWKHQPIVTSLNRNAAAR